MNTNHFEKSGNYFQKPARISIFSRIREGDLENAVRRLIWRFSDFRKLVGLYRGQIQKIRNSDQSSTSMKPVIENVDVDSAIEGMKQESVAFGFQMPANLVDEIYHFSCSSPCNTSGIDKSFLVQEAIESNWDIMVANVKNPMKCSAIQKLTNCSTLFEVAKGYLNYAPQEITPVLFWSLPTKLPEKQQKVVHSPINYHYDVPGYNTARVYFYLTDVNETSGPHVMVKGTHDKKPISWLFGSVRKPDSTVLQYFGKDKEISITGQAGFGFFQDPHCYHKGTTPISSPRLMLQIRYR